MIAGEVGWESLDDERPIGAPELRDDPDVLR